MKPSLSQHAELGALEEGANNLARAPLLLPPPGPKWVTEIINYKKGPLTPIQHIHNRHAIGSPWSSVGKFDTDRATKIMEYISDAHSKGRWIAKKPGGYDIVYHADNAVGVDDVGKATNIILIHLRKDLAVLSAYPVSAAYLAKITAGIK